MTISDNNGSREVVQPTVSDYSSLKRKQWVLEQYLDGRLPFQIREEYKQLYKLSDASYDKDVLWTNTALRKQGEYETQAIIERHTDRYNRVYELAMSKGNLGTALKALKHIEDLYKIHEKAKQHVSLKQTNNINLPSMSIEQLRQVLNRNPSNTVIDIDSTE